MDYEKFVKENLKELATEIIEWQKTSVLHGGEGGKLRELANILSQEYKMPRSNSLDVALKLVKNRCLEYTANH